MEISKIIELAKKLGFSDSVVVETNQLCFEHDFRQYCAENLCGQYDANYSCPPACGTPQEMENKILRYPKALVLESRWHLDDLKDNVTIQNIRKSHNAWSLELLRAMRAQCCNCFLVGAGPCNLCSPCKRTLAEACPHPDLQFSCVSAYCVNVKKMAELCRMEYEYKNGIISFYGMIVFSP